MRDEGPSGFSVGRIRPGSNRRCGLSPSLSSATDELEEFTGGRSRLLKRRKNQRTTRIPRINVPSPRTGPLTWPPLLGGPGRAKGIAHSEATLQTCGIADGPCFGLVRPPAESIIPGSADQGPPQSAPGRSSPRRLILTSHHRGRNATRSRSPRPVPTVFPE